MRPDLRTSSNSFPFFSNALTSAVNDFSNAPLSEARQPNRVYHVVGGLRHVDVIVRMNGSVLAALGAEDFVGAVGEDFVDVHVVRSTGAGLIDVDDELIAVLPGENLVGCLHSSHRPALIEPPFSLVSAAARLMDGRVDERGKRLQSADREILTARSVCTPYKASADFERAERILSVRVFSVIVA